jgi:hypothetical protein
MPDEQRRIDSSAARRGGEPIARVVRGSLPRSLAGKPDLDSNRRIAAILHFARFAGPTGDIDQLLEEIGRGRSPR